MKHSTRILHRVLTASLLLCGLLGTGTVSAASWREYTVDRKPDVYLVGNQNFNTNDCVGWSCRGALLGTPVHARGFKIPPATAIFERALKLKSRPSGKIDPRHGAEALLEMGLIDEYETLSNPYEIWDWLKYEGPVAAAIYWDARLTNHRGSLGEVSIDSYTWKSQKAHAITILGWDAERRAFYFTPNLGKGWGNQGYAFLRETDFPHVFVNAVGFEHGKKLSAAAIGSKPPGSRDKLRAVAAANIWYTNPGPMKIAKLGEASVNVGANLNPKPGRSKVATPAAATPKATAEAKPVEKTVARPAARTFSKSRARSVAKTAPKPSPKPNVKPVPKPIAKPSPKPSVKPVEKTVAKPSARPAAKTFSKSRARSVAKTVAAPKPNVKPVPKPIEKTARVPAVAETTKAEAEAPAVAFRSKVWARKTWLQSDAVSDAAKSGAPEPEPVASELEREPRFTPRAKRSSFGRRR